MIAITQPTAAEPSQAPGPRRRGRPPGRPGARARQSVLLSRLAGAVFETAEGAIEDALQRIWFSGFCAGVARAAPERVKRCANCGELFMAGNTRAIYCGPRCRNTVLKRRYRARLGARRAGPCAGNGEPPSRPEVARVVSLTGASGNAQWREDRR